MTKVNDKKKIIIFIPAYNVEKKILSLYEMCGGFGTLLSLVYDNMDNQKGWERSMQLLAEEVMPRFAEISPD